MKAMPLLKQWLAWRPGDGWSIRVGRDPILGLAGSYRLSNPLLSHLLNRRIYFLAQASINYEDDRFTGWEDAQTINLIGSHATEWNDYIYKIRNTGLSLHHCKDSLFWSRNVNTGNITAALAYSSSVNTTFLECIPLWFKEVWHWKLPLKTVLFSWLLLADRILTWNLV